MMQNPEQNSAAQNGQEKLFTAAVLAPVLRVTRNAILKRLAVATPGQSGPPTNGWSLGSLPEDWQAQLAALARRKGYGSAMALLSDAPAKPWTAPMPFQELPARFRFEAEQWREALLPVLTHQDEWTAGELLRAGLGECRKVFGREISESTWRRHFDLVTKRDNGFRQWARLDLYIAEEAFTRQPTMSIVKLSPPPNTDFFTDAFRQVEDCQHPTPRDRDFIFEILVKYDGPKELAFDHVLQAVPGLSRSLKALKKWYRRKANELRAAGGNFEAVSDRRAGKSGRKGPSLCPECKDKVVGAAVDLDGDLAQGWRRLILEKKLCRKCAGLWHYDVRTNKSYVPLAVRNLVTPEIQSAIPWRHGPKHVRLCSPYVLRRPDIGPGDVFEADDVNWNHLLYQDFVLWDTDQEGRVYVGRPECLLFIDRRTWYPLGYRLIAGDVDANGNQRAAHYSGVDVRLGVLHVHDRVGLPREGFQFENSIWRSRLVAGRQIRGWQFNQWRDFERGLNDKGIIFGPREKAVRHALPGNPRTKIIERMIRAVQERMRPLPGFVGFNHREYKPEVLDDFVRRVKCGKEQPGQMLHSMSEFSAALDAELMAFANEVQNGRWLPGVSPMEAWQNGIGGRRGIKDRPLRQLPETARHLLSTHWREQPVTAQGIRFEVGGRVLVFWGDELIPWKHKMLPVRWNIEEPELLHCLPRGGTPFTMKNREIGSDHASRSELAGSSAARQRWAKHGKAIFDNLPHPLRSNVTFDTEHDPAVHATGEAINRATAEHQADKRAKESDRKRLTDLAGTLGVPVRRGEKVTKRSVEAERDFQDIIQQMKREENPQ